jgi:preprotein translocase subunit SecA
MIGVIARKLFGSSNERRIKGYLPRVAQINALEKELAGLSDEALRARTEAFKRRSRRVRAWTTSWCRPLPPAGRRRSGRWGSGTSTCSSSAG